MSKKLNTEEFIIKSVEKHGNCYDYSLVNYVNQKTPVKIICKEHGEFFQLPSNHYWKGQGCPVCAQRKRNEFRTTPFERFHEQAIRVHGTKYEYVEKTYVNKNTPIDIICPTHGIFSQLPASHTNQKQGCPLCAGKNKTQVDHINDFIRAHGRKYDYSLVEFKNTHTKIEIICPVHGSFLQTPAMHKSGQGCPKCGYANHHGKYSDSYFRENKELDGNIYVWELYNDDEVFIKIGITKTTVKKRINNNKTREYKTKILFEHKTSLQEAYKIEQLILRRYGDYKYTPLEYFQGRTECLLITQKQSIINDLKQELKL